MADTKEGLVSMKFHVYRGPDAGTESCDFTGDKEIGEEQDDHHRTIPQLEVDPASEKLQELVREYGPYVNKFFDGIKELGEMEGLGRLASALGLKGEGPVGIRVGLWPGDGRK